MTSIVGSQTGPGESVNEITYYDIIDNDGNSYKAMYNVTRQNGRLVVVGKSGSGTSAGGNKTSGESDTESLVESEVQRAVSGGSMVLGAQRSGDGTTGLLTKNNTSGTGNGNDAEAVVDAGDSSVDDGAAVLGARRSATADVSMPTELRIVFIVLCLMALMAINIKRSNN